MKPWSNIETPSNDLEIIQINRFEKHLGNIPVPIRQIRNLITGFEVCHFKYQRHIQCILDSILKLKPHIVLKKIGSHHIRHGENAWENDKTGRSLIGQHYFWALDRWLDVDSSNNEKDNYNEKFNKKIAAWLGSTDPEKERLVRLLKARLIWDWKSYKRNLGGENPRELELQVCRMDICHFDFPKNLNLLLQGIGKMDPVPAFSGCGSYDAGIQAFAEKECLILNDMLKSISMDIQPNKKILLKTWLLACLAKTLKEQVRLTLPIHEIRVRR